MVIKHRSLTALWGPLDQVASSATNLVVAVAVARGGSVSEFAAISAALLGTTLGLGILRSVSGEVLIARGAEPGQDSRRDFISAGPRATILLVLAASLFLAAIRFGFDIDTEAIQIGTAGLLVVGLQDSLRYLAFADGRGNVALLSDALWFAAAGAGLVLVRWDSWIWAYTIWAGASLLGTASAWIMLRGPRSTGSARSWFVDTWSMGRSFLVEYVAVGGASLAGLLLLSASASAPIVSAIRGVQVLSMPIGVLLAGGALTLPRVLAKTLQLETRRRHLWGVGAAIFCVAILGSVCILVLPARFGEQILGASWVKASTLRLWLPLYLGAGAIAMLARTTVRALGVEKITSRRQLRLAPLSLLGPMFGARVAGASGAMVAITATTASVAAVWALEAHRGLRLRLSE